MSVCFSIASLGRIGKFSKKSTSKNAFKEKMKILKTIIKKQYFGKFLPIN